MRCSARVRDSLCAHESVSVFVWGAVSTQACVCVYVHDSAIVFVCGVVPVRTCVCAHTCINVAHACVSVCVNPCVCGAG